MKSKNTDKIIESLSLKHNLPQKVVRMLIMVQYEFLRQTMREGVKGKFETFASVRLKFFGVWKVKRSKMWAEHKRAESYRKYAEKKREIWAAEKARKDEIVFDKE